MSELTDRMRTCAAYIIANRDAAGVPTADVLRATADAADLLIEASNMLEAVPADAVDLLAEARNMLETIPAPPGEPMEIIPPVAPRPSIEFGLGNATWLAPGDTLPKANPYRSALSMLTFYINRAGKNLPASRRKVLDRAKDELKEQFHRD